MNEQASPSNPPTTRVNEQASPPNPATARVDASPDAATDISARAAAWATASGQTAAPLNEPGVDDLRSASSVAALRFAPRTVAISQAILMTWLYLAFGEFVLAGLPEGFGWLLLITISVASYFVTEARVAPYLPERSPKQRLAVLAMTAILCGALLMLAMLLGALLPEPIVTVLLFFVLAFMALWKHVKQTRLLTFLPEESTWLVTLRLMLFGALSLLAVIKALGRMT